MNIAYLIMAWHKPGLLKRIVDRLDQPDAYFYIHIDKKNKDIQAFNTLFENNKNVEIFSEYKVYWGGISQVKTSLFLFNHACNSKIDFKYLVLLTGQDYPIKSNEYINDFFDKHSCDFISYNRIADLPEQFANKYRYFHYLDSKYINPKDPHKIKLLYYIYQGFYKRFGKYLPHRSFYKNFEPYFGSDWFVLTKDTVKYVLDFVSAHKDYLRFMTYTEIPSEIFIHSILLNSERKTNLCDYDKFAEWLKNKKHGTLFNHSYSSLRYMDWSDRGKEHSKPAILDISYFDILKNDRNLFARKVDDEISAGLLDKIDSDLLH